MNSELIGGPEAQVNNVNNLYKTPFDTLLSPIPQTQAINSKSRMIVAPRVSPHIPSLAVNARASPMTIHDSSTLDRPPTTSVNTSIPKRKPEAGPSREPAQVGMSAIRSVISRDYLSTAQKAGGLFKYLRPKDDGVAQFVPNPIELREILVALRDHASAEFLMNMADNVKYAAVFNKWLKKMNKDPEEWESTIVPMLQVSLHVVRDGADCRFLRGRTWLSMLLLNTKSQKSPN